METNRRLALIISSVFIIGLLGALVFYLRSRNAPEADLVPLRSESSARPAVRPGSGTPSTGQVTGGKDNGYTVVPYEQLPRTKPDPSLPLPKEAPVGEPVAQQDGSYSLVQ